MKIEMLQTLLEQDPLDIEKVYPILLELVLDLERGQTSAFEKIEKHQKQYEGLKETLILSLENMEMEKNFWKVSAELFWLKIKHGVELPEFKNYFNLVEKEVIGNENYTKPTIGT